MARIKYLQRADSPDAAIWDRLERERKLPTANIFLALTQTPELLDGFLTYANALRSSPLSPRLRELAILTVGHVTASKYEIAHHQSHGLKAGLTPAQLGTAYQEMAGRDGGSPTTIAVQKTQDEWPDKAPGDLRWVYVAIANDTFSEGVSVVVAQERSRLAIRSFQLGKQ